MMAHDCILAARVKQTQDANRHRQPCPFKKGDLVNDDKLFSGRLDEQITSTDTEDGLPNTL